MSAEMKQETLNRRTKRNTLSLAKWTFAWLASSVLLAFGPKFLWNYETSFSWMVLVMNLVLGAKMLWANKQHLMGLDEMQQRIQLFAMSVSLGVGLIAACAYQLLQEIQLITFEPKIAHLVILMSLVYLASIIAGHRKYA